MHDHGEFFVPVLGLFKRAFARNKNESYNGCGVQVDLVVVEITAFVDFRWTAIWIAAEFFDGLAACEIEVRNF
jgi:hypothetical protein